MAPKSALFGFLYQDEFDFNNTFQLIFYISLLFENITFSKISFMSLEDIRALLNDIESDRVERTISTTNTDKFGQAI